MAASALDSNIQHATVVNEGGQRVITIVTDQHGNLQTTGGMSQPFFVTMQHGQQSTAPSACAQRRPRIAPLPSFCFIFILFCVFSAGSTSQYGDGGGGRRGAPASTLQEEEA